MQSRPTLSSRRKSRSPWITLSLRLFVAIIIGLAILIFVLGNAMVAKHVRTNQFFWTKSVDETDPKKHPSSISNTDTGNPDQLTYHLVFSTDCSPYQRWQSYLFFHNAMKVHQPGFVTRIASGCTGPQAQVEAQWHQQYIQVPMSSNFKLHLTPNFSSVKDSQGRTTGESYEFFNKPFGLKHWIEKGDHGFMSILNRKKNQEEDPEENRIFILLLDPDMVLTRPMTRDFTDHFRGISTEGLGNKSYYVQKGQPFAQMYGFGNQWMRLDLAKITGDADSPAKRVSKEDGLQHYPVGPPYVATLGDMYDIAVAWSRFVPEVYVQYPHLLAEMFAYCIAAAHLKLPHTLLTSGMVSNTEMSSNEEGWSLIDSKEYKDECAFAETAQTASNQRSNTLGKGGNDNKQIIEISIPRTQPLIVPNVIHFCQRYILGKWMFGKRRVPNDFFSCTKPLLKSPAADLSNTMYDYWIPPPPENGGNRREITNMNRRKREAFMICFLIKVMNAASSFFKDRHCADGNLKETMELWLE